MSDLCPGRPPVDAEEVLYALADSRTADGSEDIQPDTTGFSSVDLQDVELAFSLAGVTAPPCAPQEHCELFGYPTHGVNRSTLSSISVARLGATFIGGDTQVTYGYVVGDSACCECVAWITPLTPSGLNSKSLDLAVARCAGADNYR